MIDPVSCFSNTNEIIEDDELDPVVSQRLIKRPQLIGRNLDQDIELLRLRGLSEEDIDKRLMGKNDTGTLGCECKDCTARLNRLRSNKFHGYNLLDPKKVEASDDETFYVLCEYRIPAFIVKERRWGRR